MHYAVLFELRRMIVCMDHIGISHIRYGAEDVSGFAAFTLSYIVRRCSGDRYMVWVYGGLNAGAVSILGASHASFIIGSPVGNLLRQRPKTFENK